MTCEGLKSVSVCLEQTSVFAVRNLLVRIAVTVAFWSLTVSGSSGIRNMEMGKFFWMCVEQFLGEGQVLGVNLSLTYENFTKA